MRPRILAFCLSALLILAMISEVSAGPPKGPSGSLPNVEAKSIQRLGQGLAKALASPVFRARIAEELSKSPYVEGRIPLKRLMAGDAEVRQELLWQSAIDLPWEKVAGLLPELELYFPFANHRQAWAGEAEIQVAVPAEIPDTYRIYAIDGNTWLVQGPNPPAVPTLLLAPSEIDYDDEESALVGGVRTGDYLRQRAVDLTLFPEWSNEGKHYPSPLSSVTAESGSGLDASRHTYWTSIKVPENHDEFRGSMEIEVFASVDGSYSGCDRVTDVVEDEEKPLFAPGQPGSKKIAFAVPTGANTVDVNVYEDDDIACVVSSGRGWFPNGDDYLGSANLQITQFDFGGLLSTTTGKASIRVGTQNTSCPDSSCEGDESVANCCDCAHCGDGMCQPFCGESSSTCYIDCPVCGNGLCEGGESSFDCPEDCPPQPCGNGFCEVGESDTCPEDCCPSLEICPF